MRSSLRSCGVTQCATAIWLHAQATERPRCDMIAINFAPPAVLVAHLPLTAPCSLQLLNMSFGARVGVYKGRAAVRQAPEQAISSEVAAKLALLASGLRTTAQTRVLLMTARLGLSTSAVLRIPRAGPPSTQLRSPRRHLARSCSSRAAAGTASPAEVSDLVHLLRTGFRATAVAHEVWRQVSQLRDACDWGVHSTSSQSCAAFDCPPDERSRALARATA